MGGPGTPSSMDGAAYPLQDEDGIGEGDADVVANQCWGAVLKGDSSCCTPGFCSGKAHFKNKFCSACREGIDVPATRVRALTPEMQVRPNRARTLDPDPRRDEPTRPRFKGAAGWTARDSARA